MHLLNALPQRLDPGATPTFAGLISATLTSPASTNLTLASGAGNSSVILTASGTGGVGIGTTSPLARLSVQLVGTSPAGYSAASNSGITLDCGTNDNGVINLVGGGSLGIFRSNSSNAYDIGIAFGTNAVRNMSFNTANAERVVISATGTVSISSSTAGSSNAGALVVAGGLSAAGASYFGGAVTAGGKITSAVSDATGNNPLYATSGLTTGRGAFAITSTGAGLAFGVESSTPGMSLTGSAAYSSYFGTSNATAAYLITNSVIRLTIDGSTGAATFAGAGYFGGLLNVSGSSGINIGAGFLSTGSTMKWSDADASGLVWSMSPRLGDGAATNFAFYAASTLVQRWSSTGNSTIGGNLTVSGTGTSTFAGAVTVAPASGNSYLYVTRATQAQGQVALQLSGGTSGTDWIMYQPASSNTLTWFGNSVNRMTLDTSGNLATTGTISPQQTGTAPTYVKGAIYFDTTLNKLRVGGATGWETITSV